MGEFLRSLLTMSCEERCEPSGQLFAAPFCISSEGPCTPVRRPQTPCLDLPGGKDIIMEDQTKESCHLRPSTVALCQDFSLKWALSAHRWSRSNAGKMVQKWMCYDPRERNPVEPRTSDVSPTSPVYPHAYTFLSMTTSDRYSRFHSTFR